LFFNPVSSILISYTKTPMPQFHELIVANKLQQTSDATEITFNIPENLSQEFFFKPGQYLTLKTSINGESVRRAYSICSSPLIKNQISVAVKKVDNGKMSNFLNNNLTIGNTIEVLPPEGRFTPDLSPNNHNHLLLIAGGSGITPMMSIMKTALSLNPNASISLLYANRDVNSILFHKEINSLQSEFPNNLSVYITLDQGNPNDAHLIGQLNPQNVQNLASSIIKNQNNTEVYLCGPSPMMDAVTKGLINSGIPQQNIIIEYFNAPINDTSQSTNLNTLNPQENATVFVELYGQTHQIEVKPNTTILEAGVRAGIDPPFSCEAGICSTCMAKISEGSASMVQNNILTQDEVAQGFILTCQAHPTSKVVKLTYFD
jgi:ring-1,2-phenylacetyl-CoA epoxidase subunit PaaE